MTLEQLRKQIQGETQTERKAGLAEAKKQADAILKQANAQADALLEKAKKDAILESQSRHTQVSAARLSAKKRLAEAHDAQVQEQLERLSERLKAFADTPAYAKVLKTLVEQSAGQIGPGAVIHVRKKDMAKVKKTGVTVREMACWGGCVASTPDGRIRVNNTLEALFEERQEQLRQKIFEEL